MAADAVGRARGRSPRRRLLATAVVAALVLTAVACGIPEDESPQHLAQGDVPEILFQPDPTSTETTAVAGRQQIHTFYLVCAESDNAIVAVSNAVPVPENDTDIPASVLNTLFTEPPVGAGSAAASQIPASATLERAELIGDVLEVDVARLGSVEGLLQRLAVAQIVFTATGIEGVRGVRFYLDGQPSSVPLDEGSAGAGQVVTRADFSKLSTACSAATTTTTAPAEPAPQP